MSVLRDSKALWLCGSLMTRRWSKTDSNFRSHRRKITMALGPQATAEPLCRDLLDATYFDDAAAISDGSGAIAGCSQHFRARSRCRRARKRTQSNRSPGSVLRSGPVAPVWPLTPARCRNDQRLRCGGMVWRETISRQRRATAAVCRSGNVRQSHSWPRSGQA